MCACSTTDDITIFISCTRVVKACSARSDVVSVWVYWQCTARHQWLWPASETLVAALADCWQRQIGACVESKTPNETPPWTDRQQSAAAAAAVEMLVAMASRSSSSSNWDTPSRRRWAAPLWNRRTAVGWRRRRWVDCCRQLMPTSSQTNADVPTASSASVIVGAVRS